MIKTLTSYLKSLHSDERGQGLVEYALIIALVSVALILGLQGLGTSIGGVFTEIGTALGSAIP